MSCQGAHHVHVESVKMIVNDEERVGVHNVGSEPMDEEMYISLDRPHACVPLLGVIVCLDGMIYFGNGVQAEREPFLPWW